MGSCQPKLQYEEIYKFRRKAKYTGGRVRKEEEEDRK